LTERWLCGSTRTLNSGPKCAQSWNQIQTLIKCLFCHIYCAQLRAHLGKIIRASRAVSNRESQYRTVFFEGSPKNVVKERKKDKRDSLVDNSAWERFFQMSVDFYFTTWKLGFMNISEIWLYMTQGANWRQNQIQTLKVCLCCHIYCAHLNALHRTFTSSRQSQIGSPGTLQPSILSGHTHTHTHTHTQYPPADCWLGGPESRDYF